MHYNEFHSHKWSRVFSEACQRQQKLEAAQEDEQRKELAAKIWQGDFSDQENIFPGVSMWVPYYKAVEGEMELRFHCLREFYSGNVDQDKLAGESEQLHKMLLEDVKELVTRYGFLDIQSIEDLSVGEPADVRMPEDWAEQYKQLSSESEKYVSEGRFPLEFLQQWFLFALKGIINYNYNLNLQALLSGQIVSAGGEESLKKVLDDSRETFGWRVSRVFFVDTFPKLGIDQSQLFELGRYAMFCDQRMSTTEEDPPDESVVKVKASVLENCQLYSNFKTAAETFALELGVIGLAICDYCEEHGQKNAAIFTPPDMQPNYKRIKSLALGDEHCLYRNFYKDEDDMDRFLEAQERLAEEE